MIKLLADENFPKRATDKLSRLGYDIINIRQRDTNKRGDGKDDERVLAIAIQEQRTVVTFDKGDFAHLHSECDWHWGIVCCRNMRDRVRLAKKIDAAIRNHTRHDRRHGLRGQLIRI
jgi:predicted nuclease of predicted toxin-antitoxin system